MHSQIEAHPGTVSKILWHFTGGPRWDEERQRQDLRRKRPSDAYKALRLILKTKKLQLGQYHEFVKAKYHVRVTDKKTRVVALEPREALIKSSPVCCLADIPIAHLSYHAHRYGKFAIGFHRRAVVKHKFSPVFYVLNEAQPLQSLRRCFSGLEAISDDMQYVDIDRYARDIMCEQGHPADDTSHGLSDIGAAFESIGQDAKKAQNELRDSLAFVKTFGQNEFSTVYCEREWRSTREFTFELDDVAMIVLPKQGADPSFFDKFVKQKTVKVPRSIPIVPWEDLVEYED